MIGQDLLGKAQRAVEAANRALAASDSETAADRAYYAVYYAAWAMLESAGATRAKTHSGLIAEFSRVFVKTGKVEQRRAPYCRACRTFGWLRTTPSTPYPPPMRSGPSRRP